MADAVADTVAEPDSMESQLPADGENEGTVESSRQIEFSDGQESEQDPVSDVSRTLVNAQAESIECENQYQSEHAIVTEGESTTCGRSLD